MPKPYPKDNLPNVCAMSSPDQLEHIKGLMAGAARAHHEATGGDNPGWARWYAQHLVDDLSQAVGTELAVAELEDWLVEADRRYQRENPDQSWPRAYATWLLEDQAST
jgi:hypothetical protein